MYCYFIQSFQPYFKRSEISQGCIEEDGLLKARCCIINDFCGWHFVAVSVYQSHSSSEVCNLENIMKLKKRNQKKKTVTRKKNEEPEENVGNGKRGRVKTSSDPNK